MPVIFREGRKVASRQIKEDAQCTRSVKLLKSRENRPDRVNEFPKSRHTLVVLVFHVKSRRGGKKWPAERRRGVHSAEVRKNATGLAAASLNF